MRSPSNTTRASCSPRAIAQNLHSAEATAAPYRPNVQRPEGAPAPASNVLLCAPFLALGDPDGRACWPACFSAAAVRGLRLHGPDPGHGRIRAAHRRSPPAAACSGWRATTRSPAVQVATASRGSRQGPAVGAQRQRCGDRRPGIGPRLPEAAAPTASPMRPAPTRSVSARAATASPAARARTSSTSPTRAATSCAAGRVATT